MYQYILFDLDGTLTDSSLGITRAVSYALRHYGIEEPDMTKLLRFIGPPLPRSFMEFYDFPEAQAKEAVHVYREYYSDKGLFENKVYEGIPKLLQQLRDAGKELYVATSKPEHFSRLILEHFDLLKYFTFLGGATMDEGRNTKGSVIRYTLEENSITDLSKVLMVGDRHHDIDGAKENGIDSLGVLYGFGDRAELTEAGANYIAATPAEIAEIILK